MANPYFQFKQFTVYHDRCAMKVGIDGVLLGAWADANGAKHVLDIGTGTGLIALMVAQRCGASVDAIDIDSGAFEQAQFNVAQSPWAGRISVSCNALQEFRPDKKYDLIVSNPPYFTNSLKAPDAGRTLARHSDSLPLDVFLTCAAELLADDGRICVILPVVEGERFVELASEWGFGCRNLVRVFPMPHLPVKRLLIELVKGDVKTSTTDLIIERERHMYTDDFASLARDFYLKL